MTRYPLDLLLGDVQGPLKALQGSLVALTLVSCFL